MRGQKCEGQNWVGLSIRERGIRYFFFAKTHGILTFFNITEHTWEVVKKLNSYYASFTAEEERLSDFPYK